MIFTDVCCLFEHINIPKVKTYFLRPWPPQGDPKDLPRGQLAPPSGAQWSPKTPIYDIGTPGSPTGTQIDTKREPKAMKRGATEPANQKMIGPAGCAKRKQLIKPLHTGF